MSYTAREPPSESYLADIRGYLRITSSVMDSEIRDLIGAAREDLILGGVLPDLARSEEDPLVKRAVGTYVKAEFGLDNADSEKYREAYQTMKIQLLLSSKYTLKEGF